MTDLASMIKSIESSLDVLYSQQTCITDGYEQAYRQIGFPASNNNQWTDVHQNSMSNTYNQNYQNSWPGLQNMSAQDQTRVINQQALQRAAADEFMKQHREWTYKQPSLGPSDEELDNHPQLKDAWEKYQVIRALCGLEVHK